MPVNRNTMNARVLLFFLCLAAAGCGSGPRIDRLTADSVILAFGDSLTAGTGAEDGEGYPAVLAQLTGCRMVESGVPGECFPGGLPNDGSRLENVIPAEGESRGLLEESEE